MQLQPLFDFLADLSAHNERTWFQDHKATYTQLRAQFETEVGHLFAEMREIDPVLAGPDGRQSIFRIYRDVRFSKNKDPYKTHFSAYFTASPGKDVDAPAYYFQLGPHGRTFIGAGIYQPDRAQLAAIRQEIDYNADPLQDLLAARSYQDYYAGLSGEKLKKAPKDYPADHPAIDLLRHKSFIASQELSDETALALPDWRGYVREAFQAAVPLCNYLREAIG